MALISIQAHHRVTDLSIEELNLSRTNVTEEIITQLYSSNIRHSLTRLLLSGNKIGTKLDALTLLKGELLTAESVQNNKSIIITSRTIL